MCFGGADAGGLLPGRRGTGAMPGGTAGAFGAGSRGVPSGRRAANGARAGLGRVGPTKAACRARRRGAGTCRAAGRGRYTAAFRGGRGEGVSRAAVYGGRAGYSRGRRAYCRGAAGGGPGRTENALSCAACVGLRATGGKDGSSAGEKARFRYIRKRFSPGRGLCRFRADLSPKPCRFGRVAFSAARSDECVTPGGAGEKPRRKTKRPSERSEPHEKPDFRYRD